jgi:hypothetical protein
MIHSSENLIALSDTPAYISKLTGRKKQHVNTIYRWSQTGVAGVLLETLVIGDSRYTSKEALERFWADSTAARNNQNGIPFNSDGSKNQSFCEAETGKNLELGSGKQEEICRDLGI